MKIFCPIRESRTGTTKLPSFKMNACSKTRRKSSTLVTRRGTIKSRISFYTFSIKVTLAVLFSRFPSRMFYTLLTTSFETTRIFSVKKSPFWGITFSRKIKTLLPGYTLFFTLKTLKFFMFSSSTTTLG